MSIAPISLEHVSLDLEKTVEDFRINLDLKDGEKSGERIRQRVTECIKAAFANMNESHKSHSLTESSVVFKASEDSHVMELFLKHLHSELIKIYQSGELPVNAGFLMLTDPKLANFLFEFQGRQLRGESLGEHELAHALERQALKLDASFIVVTMFINNNALCFEAYCANRDRSTDEEDVYSSLAPRQPSYSDVNRAILDLRMMIMNGESKDAVETLSYIFAQPELVGANDGTDFMREMTLAYIKKLGLMRVEEV